MDKNTPLRNACLSAIDYCFGIDNDSLFEEFEFYIQVAGEPSAFKRAIIYAMVFTADILLSL